MTVHDLLQLFAIEVSPLEMVVRGSAVYWFLFVLFRFVMRRDTGAIGLADILVLVLIADASQNAMSGGYDSVTDGFVLVATVVGWNWLMDWGSYRSRTIRKLLEPSPLVLVRQGRLVRANMRREFITAAELMASLREHGIDKLAQVKMARMEGDGTISVIRAEPPADQAEPDEPQDKRRAIP